MAVGVVMAVTTGGGWNRRRFQEVMLLGSGPLARCLALSVALEMSTYLQSTPRRRSMPTEPQVHSPGARVEGGGIEDDGGRPVPEASVGRRVPVEIGVQPDAAPPRPG